MTKRPSYLGQGYEREGRSALIVPPYRYWLRRDWGEGPRLVCVGLNPSTADGKDDDPTIRVLRNVAIREDCGGLVMLNLYALVSTDPARLEREIEMHLALSAESYPSPVGPRNDETLRQFAASEVNRTFVAVWGAGASYARQREVAAVFGPMRCLGLNKDGSPWHPLRKALTGLWPWSPALLPPRAPDTLRA